MLLSTVSPPKTQPPPLYSKSTAILIANNSLTPKPLNTTIHFSTSSIRPTNASSSITNGSSQIPNPKRELLHQVNNSKDEEEVFVPSASAVAAAIRKASTTSPVEFIQRIEKEGNATRLVLPSSDFQMLCSEQLDLFSKIVDCDTVLSVYVRPAGSYVMDRLELQRVTVYPGTDIAERTETVTLIGSFVVPTGLRAAEVFLSNQQVEVIDECKAVVFPLVKHPFVVGFLVAEFPTMEFGTCNDVGDTEDLQLCTSMESYSLPLHSERNSWDVKACKEDKLKRSHRFTAEQRSSAINISRSLAMAYVMDQKAMLLQQSSWQNSIRMSDLVEQIRGSLSSIRSLSKMLSIHMKRSEISHDIVEDILVQGDQMRDTLQQLQDAVYLTKANIVHYNEETLRKKKLLTYIHPEPGSCHLFDNGEKARDIEMPMPPLALAPLQQHNIRPSNVSDVLADLVDAAGPLANKLQRTVKLSELSLSLQVCVEESALRQALSNLIEGALLRTQAGGKVEIISTGAPAGGILVIIDDDGPDMHYMTQMHSLTPFGPDLFSDGTIQDNITWNFISGLTVAREILESYGCVVRVISPRIQDAVFGAGGTRIELWFPSPAQEA